jgi:GNAT superfamily N-acetyltransferase
MLEFIKATEKDIKTIQEIAKVSWLETYKNNLSDEQISYMLATLYAAEELKNNILNNPNYHYYLLKNKEIFFGFIGYENHFENKTSKLHRLYFLPEAQGKGFGKEAINFLKRQCKNANDEKIILNVNKYNNAKQFYEKIGFTTYDQGVFDIGNGFVMDDYLMEIIF